MSEMEIIPTTKTDPAVIDFLMHYGDLFLGKEIWMANCARSVQFSLVGYAVGGAFLGVAYWDFFYHLVAVCVLLKILIHKVESDETISQTDIGRWFQFSESFPKQKEVCISTPQEKIARRMV